MCLLKHRGVRDWSQLELSMCDKKRYEKSPGSATITSRRPSQTQRGRGNRQNQTSTNQTNIRKALRLAPIFNFVALTVLQKSVMKIYLITGRKEWSNDWQKEWWKDKENRCSPTFSKQGYKKQQAQLVKQENLSWGKRPSLSLTFSF